MVDYVLVDVTDPGHGNHHEQLPIGVVGDDNEKRHHPFGPAGPRTEVQ